MGKKLTRINAYRWPLHSMFQLDLPLDLRCLPTCRDTRKEKREKNFTFFQSRNWMQYHAWLIFFLKRKPVNAYYVLHSLQSSFKIWFFFVSFNAIRLVEKILVNDYHTQYFRYCNRRWSPESSATGMGQFPICKLKWDFLRTSITACTIDRNTFGMFYVRTEIWKEIFQKKSYTTA